MSVNRADEARLTTTTGAPRAGDDGPRKAQPPPTGTRLVEGNLLSPR